MARKKLIRKLGCGCLWLLLIVGGLVAFTEPGRALQDLLRNGSIQALVMPKQKRTYKADHEGNLKAIYTALMLYHESEGQFPEANGWMDAIEPRIRANDMAESEAKKKLVRPGVADGEFGYAMNDAVSGKYKDDVRPNTVLIYESKQTGRNAHGDPETDRDGYALSLEGNIIKP